MRIAICDDSALDRDLIEALLRRYFSASSLRPELLPYERGDVLVQDVQDGLGFDIVFLDIYMSGHLGIDTARQLRALGFDGRIIFLTATPDFAVDSYDVEASGYLLKPLSLEKLSRVMDRVLQAFQAGTYAVRQRANVIRIPLHEICPIPYTSGWTKSSRSWATSAFSAATRAIWSTWTTSYRPTVSFFWTPGMRS